MQKAIEESPNKTKHKVCSYFLLCLVQKINHFHSYGHSVDQTPMRGDPSKNDNFVILSSHEKPRTVSQKKRIIETTKCSQIYTLQLL